MTKSARLQFKPSLVREGHPPHKRAVPWLWQWPVVREQMMRAAEVVSTENVERRVLGSDQSRLETDGTLRHHAESSRRDPTDSSRRNRSWRTTHTPAALRIIIEGEGAYTCTNGERCWMEPAI